MSFASLIGPHEGCSVSGESMGCQRGVTIKDDYGGSKHTTKNDYDNRGIRPNRYCNGEDYNLCLHN